MSLQVSRINPHFVGTFFHKPVKAREFFNNVAINFPREVVKEALDNLLDINECSKDLKDFQARIKTSIRRNSLITPKDQELFLYIIRDAKNVKFL